MTVKELRNTDLLKLKTILNEKNLEYMEKKTMQVVKRAKDTSFFKKLRKDLARLQTVISEKEILS